MSDARDVVLRRIEQALRTARIPVATADRGSDSRAGDARRAGGERDDGSHGDRHGGDRNSGDRSGGGDAERVALQERFVLEARALGVEIYVEPTSASVCDRLRTLVAGLRVLTWDPARLPYGCGPIVDGGLVGSSPREAQARAEIGVTGCHGAIAETGSLALIGGPGCSPTVSLLPPVHVAIVRPEDLFDSMSTFFAARADTMAQSANCTFVTGPSRTADIELSLTIGVHGPGRIAIVFGP